MKDHRKANLGQDLETIVTITNSQYRRRGEAVIHKVPTEWVPQREGKSFTGAHVREKAAVDYLGAYRRRPLAFDTKHTGEPRMRWAQVEPHQAQFLEDWEGTGSLAFILAGFSLSLFLVVPWEFWKEQWSYWDQRRPGAMASFKGTELAEARPEFVARTGNGLILDYLATIDQLYF